MYYHSPRLCFKNKAKKMLAISIRNITQRSIELDKNITNVKMNSSLK